MLKKLIIGLTLILGATSLNAQSSDYDVANASTPDYDDLAYSAPAFPVGEKMKGRVYSHDVMFVFAPLYQKYNGYIGYYYKLKQGNKHRYRHYIDSKWNVYNSNGRYEGEFYFPSDFDMYEIYYRDGRNDFGVKIFGNWEKYTYDIYWP